MYVVVDIWWNNGDKGCNMKPYLTLLLEEYFSVLNFEDFKEYLGSILFLLFFFLFSLFFLFLELEPKLLLHIKR
jgi:hypothetical protein